MKKKIMRIKVGFFMRIVIVASLLTVGVIENPSLLEAAASKIYEYDNSGRLITISFSKYKITFTYDKNGNLLKRSVIITK
ncbi:hypothetical protein QCD85_05265 [Paenibacillus sp. PsM32]|uniref:hypothetical protein n=1 Tax=Paenibacillus sp. PsM32 TaxID=3030536 RepID=UPI00263A4583|nr:hypothetical protein [Paenibacillus sp. PsM32]MDN4617495.1 hypothetical protein [Paenibacillus sp. PsM32]